MARTKAELSKWHGRGEASRARILDIARRLFVRQGFAATSVSQIAREAELTIPPVYYHFGNKLGLFKAVIEAAGDNIVKDMEDMPSLPLREGLAEMFDRAIRNLDAHIAGLRLRLLVGFQQDGEAEILLRMMREQRDQSVAILSGLCLAMLDTQVSRREERARLIAELFLSGLQHLCLDQMSQSVAPPLLSVKIALLTDSLARVGEEEDFAALADRPNPLTSPG